MRKYSFKCHAHRDGHIQTLRLRGVWTNRRYISPHPPPNGSPITCNHLATKRVTTHSSGSTASRLVRLPRTLGFRHATSSSNAASGGRCCRNPYATRFRLCTLHAQAREAAEVWSSSPRPSGLLSESSIRVCVNRSTRAPVHHLLSAWSRLQQRNRLRRRKRSNSARSAGVPHLQSQRPNSSRLRAVVAVGWGKGMESRQSET